MALKLNGLAKRIKGHRYVLLIMRHAKTEPYGKDGDDRSRELTDKGVKQAKAVAKGLKGMKLVPDVIACSTATRAQQTCARMLKVFGDKPRVDYHQSLYDGGVQSIMEELRHAKDKNHVMMVIGHEPTVSIAGQWLASEDSDPMWLGQLGLGMPTASVAIYVSDKPFEAWSIHDGALLAVANAKDFD